MCIYECVLSSHHELQPNRLLRPRNFQAKILGGVTISCSSESSWPRDHTCVPWASAPLAGRSTPPLRKPSCVYVHVHAEPLQSHQTPCNPMDCNPPGSAVCGVLEARILEYVVMPSSRVSFPPTGIKPVFLHLIGGRWVLYH